VESSPRERLIVGAIILLLIGTAVVLLVAMGGRSLAAGYVVLVDFDRVDSLKEGAEVRISGRRVGRLLAIRNGVVPGEPPLEARVRAQLWIESAYGRDVRRSSVVYINARGVIGERYLEVGPGDGEPGPAAEPGHVFRGVDAPLMDRLIHESYSNLRAMSALTRELAPELRELLHAADQVRSHLDQIARPGQVDGIVREAHRAYGEGRRLWDDLVASDGQRTLRRLSTQLEAIGGRGAELRRAGDSLRRLDARLDELAGLLPPDRRARLERALRALRLAAVQMERLLADARAVAAHVRAGRGTVGRFLSDLEINDDLKDTHRILKESPWRALAKPPRPLAPRGRAPRR
jgi:ABC-type transporter Mla subunit MlaD